MPLNFTAIAPVNPLYRRTTPVEKTSSVKLHLKQNNSGAKQEAKKDNQGRSFDDCLEQSIARKIDLKG